MSPVGEVSAADGALIAAHLLFMRRCDARPATIGHRQDTITRFARTVPRPLLEVDAEVLWAWQDELRERLSIASVRCYTSHARAFYRWAREQGHTSSDLSADLRTPRVPNGRARPISEDVLRSAVLCAGPRMRVWLILAGWCGLRAGEIARLTGDAVGTEVLDVDGKGGKRRTVPLPADVRAALAPWLVGSGALFRAADGRPVTPHAVSLSCAKHLRACGAGPGMTLHKLRHRYATRLFELSRDPVLVKELLGHSSLATTSVYIGCSADRAREVARTLAGSLPTTTTT